MKVRALIVEDEPLAGETLAEFAGQVEWLEIIGTAADGATAAEMIDRLCPELVFLDVQIPVISGLQLLELIKHQPFIIFTTAFDDYAIEAFELGAIDYLLKPFGIERFLKSVNRAGQNFLCNDKAAIVPTAGARFAAVLEKSSGESLTRIFVHDSRGQIVPVQIENILQFKAADDYVEIHVKGKFFLINATLNDLERRLDATRFSRIHRSHIVNLNHIKLLETFDRRLVLHLSDDSEIVASRSGTQRLKSLIF